MRREGFEQAFAGAGLALDPSLIIQLEQPTYNTDEWRTAIETLLDRPDRPTAIVAFNDAVAFEVYAVCRAWACASLKTCRSPAATILCLRVTSTRR